MCRLLSGWLWPTRVPWQLDLTDTDAPSQSKLAEGCWYLWLSYAWLASQRPIWSDMTPVDTSVLRPHTMKFHRISLVFLLLTVHPVFSGHLFLLTSCRSLALTLLSVLTPSVQLHQRFGIPFLTIRSSNTLNSFRHHLKTHYVQAAFDTPSGKPQRLWFTCA